MAIGTLRHAGRVEQAVVDRLRERMSAYTRAVLAQTDTEDEPRTAPDLKGVVTVSEFAKWPQDKLPCAIVASAGTTGDTTKDAAGFYSATYSVVVAVVVGSGSEDKARELAQIYGAAVRGCLLQQRSLGGAVEVSTWEGESFDDGDVEDRRTVFIANNVFGVELRDIVSWQGIAPGPFPGSGAENPDADPWPPATDVDAEVEAVPPGEGLESS